MRQSLWFEPVLMMAVSLVAGTALPVLERTVSWATPDPDGWTTRWVALSAEGTRQTLATSATALATILAICVTATMVVIQLAAGAYTSRLLRRFLSDRPIRLFLGAFTGSVLYLVLVLGAVRSPQEGGHFVPIISVLVGRGLTVLCLIMLVVFVHYTGRSVQAATILRRVAADALAVIESLDTKTKGESAAEAPPPGDGQATIVRADVAGYLQVVDEEQLFGVLPEDVTRLRIDLAPGEFAMPGVALLSLWTTSATSPPRLDQAVVARMRRAFAFGRERTIEQDPGFGVRQLSDMALKALSPGINDVTTAIMVVNELAVIAQALIRHDRLGGWSSWRRGDRLIWTHELGVSAITEALAEITDSAPRQPTVLARTLAVLTVLLETDHRGHAGALVRRAADRVLEVADRAALATAAQQDLRRRHAALVALGPSPQQ